MLAQHTEGTHYCTQWPLNCQVLPKPPPDCSPCAFLPISAITALDRALAVLDRTPRQTPTLWDLASVRDHVMATASAPRPPALPGPSHLFCYTYPKLLSIPEHSVQLPNSVSITKVVSLSRIPFLSSSPGMPTLQVVQHYLLQESSSSQACGPWGLCPCSHSSLCSVELLPTMNLPPQRRERCLPLFNMASAQLSTRSIGDVP